MSQSDQGAYIVGVVPPKAPSRRWPGGQGRSARGRAGQGRGIVWGVRVRGRHRRLRAAEDAAIHQTSPTPIPIPIPIPLE